MLMQHNPEEGLPRKAVVQIGQALVAVVLLLSLAAVEAADFRVAPGETRSLTLAEAELNLVNFELGDKSVVQLPAGMTQWVVKAEQARIGYGVVILGAGAAGAKGGDGLSHREASHCGPGLAGASGQPGKNGQAGVDVHWSFGVQAFGTLKVDLHGGDGGAGGDGGDGQNVPDFPDCVAPGGDAGAGGHAGAGGKGGAFRFHYSLASGVDDLTNSIAVRLSGGEGGQGGKPGLAGVGTAGRQGEAGQWLASGGEGRAGASGKNGLTGSNGSLDIRRLPLANEMLEAAPEAVASSSSAAPEEDLRVRIQELERLTQKLDARIRLLELDRK